MRQADVIIAGGGVIGMMAGWRLARDGVQVTVIDSGAPPATNAAAGMLAPSFERSLHRAGEALACFSEESLALWRTTAAVLEERSGVAIDFDDSGALSVIFDDGEAAAFEQDADGGEWLGRRDVLDLEPSLAPSVVAGRFAKDNGQVDPRRVLQALEKALVRDGGTLRRGERVVSVQSANGRVTGARLHTGDAVDARCVVIATGARVEGVTDFPAGAVFPVKGEAVAIARSGGSPLRVVRTPRAYLCPKSDGRVVIGATEIAHDWSLTTDEANINALKAGAAAACPGLRGAAEIERWAGLRPATSDGAPIIGPAPQGPDGLLYALGHYRNGILLAPATARALAALITGGRQIPSIAAFSAARFTSLGVS
jgi:glycine oxidase